MAKVPAIVTTIIGVVLLVAGLIWLAVKTSDKSTSKTGCYILISLGSVILVVGIILFFITKDSKKIKVSTE